MDEITRTQRRTQAYWFVDGIAELVGGFILAVIGILLYFSTMSTEDTYSSIALMVMIVGFPLSAKAVRFVKDRVTHERTGYVRFPEASGRRRAIAAAIGALVAAVLAGHVVRTGDVTFEGTIGTVMLALLGLTLAGSLALRGYRLELPRFYISAVVVAVVCAIALLAGLGFIAGMGAMWIGFGVASMLMGATVFAEYMTQNPATEPGADAT